MEETSKESIKWWEKDGDLWEFVNSEEGLKRVVQNANKDVVFVDWFATWCKGCQKTSPALTEIAENKRLRERVAFVKVCTDGASALAREYGVRALPWISLFSSQGDLLVGFSAAASKKKTFRINLEVVMNNPTKGFILDPNGFVVAVNKDDEVKKAKSKEEELEELRNYASGFSDQFSKSPLLSRIPEGAEGDAVDKPNVSAPSSSSSSHVDPSSISEEKKEFLKVHGNQYGYDGRIDELYKKEVGCRMGDNGHYMDYTGAAVYCQSQLDSAFQELRSNMFGNPHSQNPSSMLTEKEVEAAREMVLRFFNADPTEYQVGAHYSAHDVLLGVSMDMKPME